MTFDPRHSIDQGLHHLSQRLDPILGAKLAPSLGGLPWPTILSELDRMRGKAPKTYAATDLQSQLRAITERLGNLGFPFDDHTRVVSVLGSELRIVRNRWAHHDELSTLDAWRAQDFAVRLLEKLSDIEGARTAEKLREQAFDALVEEKGVAGHASPTPPPPAGLPANVAATGPAEGDDQRDLEVVRPAPVVFTRTEGGATPTIGSGRFEFQPWAVVQVGDVSVLDDLPKKLAKEQVRAVASEIAEFEGPVHIDRLARLTAASFGVQRLWPARLKKVTYQIRQIGLVVDDGRFVWPSDLDPSEWDEFRPNDSTVDRAFTEISPTEIANAMRFLRADNAALSGAELDAATLQTFGRHRKTRSVASHLDLARKLV